MRFGLGGRRGWEPQQQGGAQTLAVALGQEGAAALLRDLTADVQPEPQAGDVRLQRVRGPAKRSEDLLGHAGRQPDALIPLNLGLLARARRAR
jgi:hypothetical protein